MPPRKKTARLTADEKRARRGPAERVESEERSFLPPRTRSMSHVMGRAVHPVGEASVKKPLLEHVHVRDAIHRELIQQGIPQTIEPEHVEAALAEVDQHAILQKHRERHQIVVWDQKSAINGVPAKKVLADLNHDYDTIYLIFVDGELVMFQPHEPWVQGIVTMKDGSHVETVALRHVEVLARHEAARDIISEVRSRLPIEEPVEGSRALNEFEDVEVPGLSG